MISLFKKKEVKELNAPIKGELISLDNVPDKVFSERMMGDGVAINPIDNTLYAPCDGTIVMVASTKHALGLKTANHIEILIHVGLETVNLNGKGLDVLCKVNQKVKQGTPLLKIDLDYMNSNNINLVTPIIITSKNNFEVLNNTLVDNSTPIIEIL